MRKENNMFKKVVLVLLLGCVLSSLVTMECAGQKTVTDKSFQMSGELIGDSTKFVVLRFVDNQGKNITDTCYIKDGRLNFQGNIEQPTLAMLTGRVKTKNYDDPNTIRFFLEPKKMSISIAENNFPEAKITGSDTQRDMDLLSQQNSALLLEVKNLLMKRTIYNNRIKISANKDTIAALKGQRDQLQSKLTAVNKNIKSNQIDFIKNHPKSYASAYLFTEFISDRSIPIFLIKSIYHDFAGDVKESKLGKDNLLRINNRLAADQLALLKNNYSLESVALQNEQNKTVKFNNFIGKSLVIVDFWASWCIPCVKSSPNLKKIYNTYSKDGLQVITVSIDKRNDDWISAVKKNGYDIFVNFRDIPDHLLTIDDLKNPEGIPLSRKWNIDYIPSIILFDKNGSVVSKFDKIDDEYRIIGLEEKIREYYGNGKPNNGNN
ncbi:AhpC/TSA family protein [Pedobacter sp. HDW13]|uniref:TlpA disulfide reductase family protein n=1 Tax=Pedobacter sp. HDW13 TaxID=2714940 RepID=UPI00140AA028|nr:TlpA disulfide reductase family protein [Pedobacter sp. HDW13]QIL38256.1 AhpC/TSA family protein [Pedobacter sp. HDW13]